MALHRGLLIGDRYLLAQQIAVGGMGEVWEAADQLLGRQVAVKLLRSEFGKDTEFIDRFRVEARTAGVINHRNIAAVHDYGEDADAPDGATAFLVMELVHGEPLSTRLAAKGKLEPAEALALLEQAGRALQAAHAHGFVHRDVKPANILLSSEEDTADTEGPDAADGEAAGNGSALGAGGGRIGAVKLTDFGIAKAANAPGLTEGGLVLGTAHYIAPEQAVGEDAGPASDVYSLGVVGYESLAGHRPYHADSSADVAAMHVNDPLPPLPSEIPEQIRKLIEFALVKNPNKRYRDGTEFTAAVAAVRRGRPAPRPGSLSEAEMRLLTSRAQIPAFTPAEGAGPVAGEDGGAARDGGAAGGAAGDGAAGGGVAVRPRPTPTPRPGTSHPTPTPRPGTSDPSAGAQPGPQPKPSPTPKPGPQSKPSPTPKPGPRSKPSPTPKPIPTAQRPIPTPSPRSAPSFGPTPAPKPSPSPKPALSPKSAQPKPTSSPKPIPSPEPTQPKPTPEPTSAVLRGAAVGKGTGTGNPGSEADPADRTPRPDAPGVKSTAGQGTADAQPGPDAEGQAPSAATGEKPPAATPAADAPGQNPPAEAGPPATATERAAGGAAATETAAEDAKPANTGALPGGLRALGTAAVAAGVVGADSATLRIDAPRTSSLPDTSGSGSTNGEGRATSGAHPSPSGPHTTWSGTPTAWPGTPTPDLGEPSGSAPHRPVSLSGAPVAGSHVPGAQSPPGQHPAHLQSAHLQSGHLQPAQQHPGRPMGDPVAPSARPAVDTSRERAGVTPLTWAFILLTIAAIVLGVIVVRNALIATQPGVGPGPAGIQRPGAVPPPSVSVAFVTDLTPGGKPCGTAEGSTTCPTR